jgi:hypothetical protein
MSIGRHSGSALIAARVMAIELLSKFRTKQRLRRAHRYVLPMRINEK